MNFLINKRVLLGVTGGIAAYKSAELVRRLRDQGAEVRVVMSSAACQFITPLTMQALSGKPVHTELLDHDSETGMGHIELARWSDVILVAPASANFIARLTHGMADDLLSTLCLAANVPLMVAPAMNHQMWLNRATQVNIETLKQREISILGPAIGGQACGETGPGRMLEPSELLTAVRSLFHRDVLSGTNVMVTAGPTREAIDPVRFISNRSSGRMGFSMAEAASEAGANVTLISGPVSLDPPDQVRCIRIKTAEQMRDAVMSDAMDMDIFIATAAVADYRCANIALQKIKKVNLSMSLTLEKTPDILAEVAALKEAPFTVGFAAETESLKDNAIVKLQRKGLDMIAANMVGEDLGFEDEVNALEIFWQGGSLSLGESSKDKIARQLIDVVAERFYERKSHKAH